MKALSTLLIIILTSSFLNAQSSFGPNPDYNNWGDNNNTTEVCVKLSCCSVLIFGIEIWTHNVCTTIEMRNNEEVQVMTFEIDPASAKNLKRSTIEVEEDLIVPNLFNPKGVDLIVPKGTYNVVNNMITVYPKERRAKELCITQTVEGTIFGNPYSTTISICISISISIGTKTNEGQSGLVTIQTNLETNQLRGVNSTSKNEITFKKDIVFNKDGVNFTIAKGSYTLNEDGTIYLPNTKINRLR